jgi:hypothetical protein
MLHRNRAWHCKLFLFFVVLNSVMAKIKIGLQFVLV